MHAAAAVRGQVGAGWLLERLNALPHDEFRLLSDSESDLVRTHAAPILA